MISLFTGQLPFFRMYLRKIGRRMTGKSMKTAAGSQEHEVKNLVIFASGAGSNAQQIIHYFRDSESIRVALVVSNRPNAGVLNIAAKENIPVLIIEKERFFRGDAYINELRAVHCDLIVLAGFLWKIPQALIDAYPRSIINIHPALLPKYGGRGMYGQYVHEAVIQAGEMESGITVHYVDEHYDHGDVIFQAACPVLDDDDKETLAGRIHQLEHLHYPRVIEKLLTRTEQPS
jgi:formyltetrahydrofolate-dependent phosphoribosylglycinamide formyltransferase